MVRSPLCLVGHNHSRAPSRLICCRAPTVSRPHRSTNLPTASGPPAAVLEAGYDPRRRCGTRRTRTSCVLATRLSSSRSSDPCTLSCSDFSPNAQAFAALTVGSQLSPSRRSKMTDDEEHERPKTTDDEQPKKTWANARPTLIGPPQRAPLPLPQPSRSVQPAVPAWDRKNKAQKVKHGDDASSSARRASTSSTPAKSKAKKKTQEVIEIPDDDEPSKPVGLAAMLNVSPNKPFSQTQVRARYTVL